MLRSFRVTASFGCERKGLRDVFFPRDPRPPPASSCIRQHVGRTGRVRPCPQLRRIRWWVARDFDSLGREPPRDRVTGHPPLGAVAPLWGLQPQGGHTTVPGASLRRTRSCHRQRRIETCFPPLSMRPWDTCSRRCFSCGVCSPEDGARPLYERLATPASFRLRPPRAKPADSKRPFAFPEGPPSHVRTLRPGGSLRGAAAWMTTPGQMRARCYCPRRCGGGAWRRSSSVLSLPSDSHGSA